MKTKKTLLLLSFILLLTAVLSLVATAEEDPFADLPVIYVASQAKGTGDGSSPENAMGNAGDYESTLADADTRNKAYLKHALRLAFDLLKPTGGTVVVCEKLTVNCADAFRDTPAEFYVQASRVDLPFKLTSVYDGVDYRATNGAKLILDQDACHSLNLIFRSRFTMENLTVDYKYSKGTSWYPDEKATMFIYFDGMPSVVGEGVTVNSVPVNGGTPGRYPTLIAGHRYLNVESTDLTVKSGTWDMVIAGGHGMGERYPAAVSGDAKLTVSGGTINHLYGEGGTHKTYSPAAEVKGKVIVTIEKGAVVKEANGSPTSNRATNKSITYEVTTINKANITNFAAVTQTGIWTPPSEDDPETLFGDANGDGKVTALDVVRLKKYLAAGYAVAIFRGADTNGDGVTDVRDVARLKRYFAEYDPLTGNSPVELGTGAGWTEPGNEPGGNDSPLIIPAVDYGGYEFSFICQPYRDNTAYPVNYMVSEGEGVSPLLDAVYRRNAYLGEKYNVTFNQIQTSDLVTNVRAQVLSGTTEFDVIVGSAKRLATFAREGLLLDLLSVDRFNMNNSYWDQNANAQLKIGDKLYFTNCDFNVQELGFGVYFNKQVIRDYNLISPYEYLENGNWTLDTWAELTKTVSKDMNGDGRMGELDQFGTLYEYHNPRMFLYGSGIRATTNDSTGYPRVTLFSNSDRLNTAYEKLKSVFSDKTISFDIVQNLSSDNTHGYADKWDYARSLFMQDLFLFHYEGTNIIHQFANMEHEFGFIPFPKYDTKQQDYYSLYPANCNLVALPSTLSGDDLDRTATVFEGLNLWSKEMVRKYWYETILTRRYSRDEESQRYLDVIRNGRVYDLGLYFDFGGITARVLDADCATNNISTAYARIKNAIEADIKVTYNALG